MSTRLADETPPGYPEELEADVLLADGLVAELRPVVPADAVAFQRFAEQLSDETRYLRFFSYRKALTERELRHFTTVDYDRRLALIALVDGEMVAVGRYERVGHDGDDAEVAFTVRDDQQGRGLGTVLLEHLASAARARGIRRFVADTLGENRKMMSVFQKAGFDEQARFESGLIRVELVLEAGEHYLERVEDRDRMAAIRSVTRLLEPASVAVIGASPTPGSVGYELVANLVRGGYPGTVYPVHRSATEVAGIPAFASIGEVGKVDLAVIAVPARSVPDVVEECGHASAGGLVIVSVGFSESGPEGLALEREVVARAHRYGMRVIGPNSMGIVNSTDRVRMNATFAPFQLSATGGRVAFCSQSGGLGVALLLEAERRGLGVSGFVSVGNKSDVSSNDLIRYWDADGETDVIALHLESFGNPRHFRTIARSVARRHPIVAVKARRASAVAAGDPDRAVVRGPVLPEATVDALFRQAGVIRVDTLEELFDVAEVVTHQPLPAGNRVAIVANAGGPSVLAADACEAHGLDLARLSESTRARLTAGLTPGGAVANPVDCVPWAPASEYRLALEAVVADECVDAVIVIFTPALDVDARDVAKAVVEVASHCEKPIVANFLASGPAHSVLRDAGTPVPWFAYPESAVRALAKVVPYARWRAAGELAAASVTATSDGPAEPVPNIERSAARAIVEEALTALPAEAVVTLEAPQAEALLAAYAIAVSPGPAKKAVPDVPAMVIGAVEDASFGPIVFTGVAGRTAEVLGDRSVSLAPVSSAEARAMLGRLGSAPLLGAPVTEASVDLDSLASVIARVGALAEDLPEVLDLRLEPVVWQPSGWAVGGVQVRLRRGTPEPELLRRSLRLP